MEVKIKPYSRNIHNDLLSMKVKIAEKSISQEIRINPLQNFEIIPRPTKESLDVLYFAVFISVIDRLIKREWFADNWSRNIEIEIPVSNPILWNKAKSKFEEALNFLSGDNWVFSFINTEKEYFETAELPLEVNNTTYKHVCLFSGGLDSLVGGIDLIEESDNIILVSYYDGHGALQGKQNEIFSDLQQDKNIFLNQFAFNKIKSNEDTTRARSVLFLGLALFTSINLNIKKIITPENGLISINLPLTSSRGGANSTRTMHPYFINTFQEALNLLGHKIEIENPYIYKPKGEMLVKCLNKPILNKLIDKSMSCSHPSMNRYWIRRDIKHCGYCMPCIIRRASIYRYDKLLDKANNYGIDIFNTKELNLEQDGVIPRNIKATLEFLSHNQSEMEFKKLMNQVVKVDNGKDLSKMLVNGYNEIKVLIKEKGTKLMKEIVFG